MQSIYQFDFKDTKGKTISLDSFRGKVLLIVNTATKCGLAPQFTDLEALHQRYKHQGLVVIGFPCAQFMGQEPESNENMVEACKINFGVTFQLSEKIDVNGPSTHPIFEYLKSNSDSTLGNEIKWNFTKFLITPDGHTIERFAPTTSPQVIEPKIKELLESK